MTLVVAAAAATAAAVPAAAGGGGLCPVQTNKHCLLTVECDAALELGRKLDCKAEEESLKGKSPTVLLFSLFCSPYCSKVSCLRAGEAPSPPGQPVPSVLLLPAPAGPTLAAMQHGLLLQHASGASLGSSRGSGARPPPPPPASPAAPAAAAAANVIALFDSHNVLRMLLSKDQLQKAALIERELQGGRGGRRGCGQRQLGP